MENCDATAVRQSKKKKMQGQSSMSRGGVSFLLAAPPFPKIKERLDVAVCPRIGTAWAVAPEAVFQLCCFGDFFLGASVLYPATNHSFSCEFTIRSHDLYVHIMGNTFVHHVMVILGICTFLGLSSPHMSGNSCNIRGRSQTHIHAHTHTYTHIHTHTHTYTHIHTHTRTYTHIHTHTHTYTHIRTHTDKYTYVHTHTHTYTHTYTHTHKKETRHTRPYIYDK